MTVKTIDALGIWIGRAQVSFDADPPDSDHQRGYLAAVEEMRAVYDAAIGPLASINDGGDVVHPPLDGTATTGAP